MPPTKIRLKLYLGDGAESLEALRLHVSGRTARLRQAGLDEVALRKAVQREILVLALHGYPREMMLRVWSRSRQYPAAAKLASLILGTWNEAFFRFEPTQAGLGLGWSCSTAVGGLTGRPLQAYWGIFKNMSGVRDPAGSLAERGAGSNQGVTWRLSGVCWGSGGAPGGPWGLGPSPRRRPPPPSPAGAWLPGRLPSALLGPLAGHCFFLNNILF